MRISGKPQRGAVFGPIPYRYGVQRETVDQVFRYDDIERIFSDEVQPLFPDEGYNEASDVRSLLGGEER